MTGVWGLGFTSCWLVAVTIPRWTQLVTEEIAAQEGDPLTIAALYFSHMLNNAVRRLRRALYTLLPTPLPPPALCSRPHPRPRPRLRPRLRPRPLPPLPGRCQRCKERH